MRPHQQRSPDIILRELRQARVQLMYQRLPRMRRMWELRRDALALELALSSPSVVQVGPT